MATALDIITRSLRDLGVLGIGEVPDADQAANGLVTLNDLMESLANENLMIYATTTTSIPMTNTGADAAGYQYGTTGGGITNPAAAIGLGSWTNGYGFRIKVDGGVVQNIALNSGFSAATTFTELVAGINNLLTGAVCSITNADLLFTSNTIGSSSSIALTDDTNGNEAPLFSAFGFTSFPAAVQGTGSATAYALSSRYISLDNAYFSLNSVDYPVSLITKEQYQDISLKTLTGSIPSCIMYDTQYPTGMVYVYPVPTTGTLKISGRKPFTVFTTLTDDVSLPPGYNAMLRANLANDMQSEYGKNRQKIAIDAQRLKANLKRTNHRPRIMTTDMPIDAMNRNSYLIERGY